MSRPAPPAVLAGMDTTRTKRTASLADLLPGFLPIGWWLVFALSGAASFAYWLLT